MDVKIYDNIIPEDLLIENYNWAKDRSFAVHYRHMYYDFVQSRDGIFSTLAQQGIYRIAVGNKLSHVEDYAPPIAKLWKLVNERVFDNKATIELAPDETLAQLIARFNLPERLVHLVLVDGVYIAPEARATRTLNDGETVAIWPPVAGG